MWEKYKQVFQTKKIKYKELPSYSFTNKGNKIGYKDATFLIFTHCDIVNSITLRCTSVQYISQNQRATKIVQLAQCNWMYCK